MLAHLPQRHARHAQSGCRRAGEEASSVCDAKYDADIRKYLASTRTDAAASWDKTKSQEEIAKIKAAGGFLDLMQWRVNRSGPVGMADDGYVLEYRNFDEGKNPFSWNIDRKTMTPLNMFDAAKVGAKALRAEDIGNPAKPGAIIKEDERGAVRSQCRLERRRHPARPSDQPHRRQRLGRRQRRQLMAPGRTAPIRWCGGASSIPDIRRTTRS